MGSNQNHVRGCDVGTGPLPACGQLAAAYVPVQPGGQEQYQRAEALARGTLFPGLDLPWMNAVNAVPAQFSGTPLGELMTLCFVVQELGLYLDTHADDREALKLYTEYAKLLRQGRTVYEERYGPVTQTQVTLEDGYTWLKGPWPWEYQTVPGEGRDR